MTKSTVENASSDDGTQESGQTPGGEADGQQEASGVGQKDQGDKTGDDEEQGDKGDKSGDDDNHPAEDDLPEWARKELTRVRRENAQRRTALKEAQDRLAEAKSPEEFAEAKSELENKISGLEYEVARNKALRAHSIPADYEDLLEGVPVGKLEEKAKKLATLVSSQNLGAQDDLDDLLGGLDPRSSASGIESVEELYNLVPR